MTKAVLSVGASIEAHNVLTGTLRLLLDRGYGPHTEVPLRNGRRADIVALGPQGDVLIVEVKSSLTDFQSDQKWPDYLPFADMFCFAVDADFPRDRLFASSMWTDRIGLIIADRYGGDMVKPPAHVPMHAARRNRVVRTLAQRGGRRLARLALAPDNHPAVG